MAGQNASVLNPENFVAGSGLLDDVDVEFKEVRVEMWDYNGKRAELSPALKVVLGVDGMEEDHIQYYSLGKATDWAPSEDGCSIVAVGKATGISQSSNAGILIASIVNAGFPVNKISDNVQQSFEGMKAHMIRVAPPKRNINKPPREDGRVFDDTVLTVATILSFPGEGGGAAKGKTTAKASGKPTGATAATTQAPAAAASDDDVDSRCVELLLEALSEKPDGLAKQQIPGAIFSKVKTDPLKNKIVTRIYQEDFLKSGPWGYDGAKVTMG